MSADMEWRHEFRISGGSAEDLLAVVRQSIFYHMQHPVLLDLFAEPGVVIRAGILKSSAILVVDVADGTRRIQRPLGPHGADLFESELRSGTGRGGVLAAGLDTATADRLRVAAGFSACSTLEQFVEYSDLDLFDPDLPGAPYKTLRSALHRAERDGVHVVPYDAGAHGKDAMRIWADWNARKPRTATHWMPDILERPARFPGLVGVAARRPRQTLGVTFALTAGEYGYMLMAITRQEHGRSQETMDYELLKILKSAGVRRLDWGVSDGGTVLAYKKKYGAIAREPISTIWIPPSPAPAKDYKEGRK